VLSTDSRVLGVLDARDALQVLLSRKNTKSAC